MALAAKIRLSVAVALVVVGVALAIGGAYGLSLMAIRNSNQQWCSAIDLLTQTAVSQPANPAANPSREEQYRLYLDFVEIGKKYGC